MSDNSVKQLAQALGLTAEKLLEQMAQAGIAKASADEVVTSTEKVKLLGFLRRQHGKREEAPAEAEAPRQITLRRKKVGELTVSSGAAKGKVVNIEVRQKRTLVKRPTEAAEQPVDAEREHALALLRESEAQRAEEERRLREADDRRAREEAERQAAEAAKREAEARAAVEAAAPAGEEAPAAAESTPAARAEAARRKEEKAREKPVKVTESPKVKERDEPRRHKGVHGSNRMQDTEVADEGSTVGRYVRGELHLADGHGRRRAPKRPKPRVEQRHSGHQGQGGFASDRAGGARDRDRRGHHRR